MKQELNIEELKQNINDWVYLNIGKNFEFREYQYLPLLQSQLQAFLRVLIIHKLLKHQQVQENLC